MALVEHFDGQVWIISKAGEDTRNRTRMWLEHKKFFTTTKIAEDNLVFCDDHHDKRGLCEDFGITHMIDGRTEVHEALEDVMAHRYLPSIGLDGTLPDGDCVPDLAAAVRGPLAQRSPYRTIAAQTVKHAGIECLP